MLTLSTSMAAAESPRMRVFIVHAHHEPKSFNGALTRHAQSVLAGYGHEVTVSDLYAMGFNPVSDRRNFVTVADPQCLKQQAEELYASEHEGFATDIRAEMAKLEWCDVLVLQFPLWWFGLPAILKGWVDRVFAMGRIYGGGMWYDRGYFSGRRAMLSLTTGGPASIYGQDGLNGDIDMLLFPIQHGVLRFTGFNVVAPFISWAPARVSQAQRETYLQEYGERLLRVPELEPIHYPPLSDYDPVTFRRLAGKSE